MDNILDINKILNDYSRDISEAIEAEAQEVAKKAQAELKATSPKRTGKYARGWRVNTTKSRNEIECIVYNTNPGLTMLLERTHAKRGGGSVTPRSAGHIQRVEESSIKEYETEVEKIIQNGGS